MEPCSVLYHRRQHLEPGFDVWAGSSHPRSAAFAVRAEVQVLAGRPGEKKRWEARSRELRFCASKKTHRVCSTLTAGKRPARSEPPGNGALEFGENPCRTKHSKKSSRSIESARRSRRWPTNAPSSAFLSEWPATTAITSLIPSL